MTATAAPPSISYTPRRPHLAALGVVSLFIVILALPMLSGRWLASPDGDQYASGYAVKVWAKNTYQQTGQFPLWNPMIMVGLPHIDVVTHGDVLYPTSALRLVMPVYQAMNLAFVIHYILAGFLMYLFLRRLGAAWVGGVTGALAYQLSGIMISYVHPGHDGKLFVSTMLPLALLALLAALRDKRAWGYPLLAIAVALCLLSPHVQTTYYLLIAAALFALYLTFGEPSSDPVGQRVGRLALTMAAVIVGFGIAMPQILPFIQYIPHSPRAGGYSVGYQGSTSYGIPWDHVPEFIIAGFTGTSFETYWGSNPLKLHSEYLGLPVIALAILGMGDRRRRLVWWTAGIGALFLLIALGASTPFYHLWWLVMPYVKKTRAPGMVFFIVAFCTATFAAFGVDRLERREVVATKHARAWLIAAGVIVLLGLVGVFGQLAQSLAPVAIWPQRLAVAIARGSFIRLSTIVGAVLFAAVGALAWGWLKGRVPVMLFAVGLPLLVGADLWRNGQHFWTYSPSPNEGLYRTDALVSRLQADTAPLRVLNFDVYPHNVLMAFGIPQVLGYQGSELRYFDDLIGGRPGTGPDAARYLLTSTRLWHLLAVRYVIIPDTANLPGYHRVLGPVTTGSGARGFLYEADTLPPYVRVVPAAAKIDEQAIPATLADPRLPGYDRVVLFPPTAPLNPRPVTTFPPPLASRGRVTSWTAGRMSITLDPPPTDSSYVLIAENWYLDWSVAVDGRPARVLRGDNSLLTIPVAAGTRRLELSYHSRAIARGLAIGLVSLLIVIAGFLVPPAWQRRRPSA